jgi:hypothetical protein
MIEIRQSPRANGCAFRRTLKTNFFRGVISGYSPHFGDLGLVSGNQANERGQNFLGSRSQEAVIALNSVQG